MKIGRNGKILILFVALTLLDIIVINFYYAPVGDWNEVWRYHIIYWILQYSIPFAWAIKIKNWQPLRMWLLWLFGLEDTAFYLLQLRIPERFWGVSIVGIWEPGWNWAFPMNMLGISLFLLLSFRFLERTLTTKQTMITKKLKQALV